MIVRYSTAKRCVDIMGGYRWDAHLDRILQFVKEPVILMKLSIAIPLSFSKQVTNMRAHVAFIHRSMNKFRELIFIWKLLPEVHAFLI